MRKILSLVLALALVLGSFSFAFAAQDDVAGHEYETAIKRLNALGLMIGDSRGFRPDDTITRAEFATLIVRALGEEATAKLLTGAQTGFTDVDSVNHWASGYIKVAAQKGLINGYGNGLFGPDDNIKVVDAIVLMTRALGYEPKAENLGGYPIGNLTVANELDINDGIDSPGSALATRGEVAKLFDNSLTVPFMVRTTWGDTAEYSVPDEDDDDYTFILNEIGATSVEGRVVSTPSFGGEEEGKVKVVWYENTDNDDDLEECSATVAGVANPDELLGHEVTIWVNTDDEALLIEDDTEEDDVLVLDEIEVTTNEDGDTVILDADDNEYALNANAKMVINREAAVALDTTDEDVEGEQGVVILNSDDEVAFVQTFVPDYREDAIVDTVDEEHSIIKFTNAVKADLDDEDYVIYKDGELIELDDIDADDVVYIAKSDDLYLVKVYDDKVTGVIDAYDQGDKVVEIDGDEYTDATDGSFDFDANLDKEVTAILDRFGQLLSVELVDDSEEVETDYALVVGTDNFSNATSFGEYTAEGQVKLLLPSDEEVVYDIDLENLVFTEEGAEDAVDFDTDDTKSYAQEAFEYLTASANDDSADGVILNGAIVEYALNEDGEIDTLTIVNEADDTTLTLEFDESRDRLFDAAASYLLDENTVIITRDSDGNYAVAALEDLVDEVEYNVVRVVGTKGDVDVIILDQPDFDEQSDAILALFVDSRRVVNKNDDKAYEYTLLTDEELELDTVDRTVYKPTDVLLVEYTVDGDGLVDAVTAAVDVRDSNNDPVYVETTDLTITDVDGYKLFATAGDVTDDVEDTETLYLLSEDVLVYDLTGSSPEIADASDLGDDQLVTVYVSNGEVVAVLITDADVYEE